MRIALPVTATLITLGIVSFEVSLMQTRSFIMRDYDRAVDDSPVEHCQRSIEIRAIGTTLVAPFTSRHA